MMALELFSFDLNSRFLVVATMDPVQLSLLVEVDYNRKYSVKARMDLEM